MRFFENRASRSFDTWRESRMKYGESIKIWSNTGDVFESIEVSDCNDSTVLIVSYIHN